jgi:hypothetical protein
MKQKLVCIVSGLAMLLILVATSPATTLTFDDDGTGEVPSNNEDVPANYGSNVASESTGYITTDDYGPTPDIGLTWSAGGLPHIFEFHSGANMAANGFDVPVVQLDCDSNPPDPTITFATTPGVALVLGSVDMGDATGHDPDDADSTWDLTITRVSDMTVVKTVQAGPYDETAYVENVRLDFTGELGEDYILTFVDTDGEDRIYTNIDNLSFGQVPEPSTMVLLLSLAGLAVLGWRRR